jgi:hypothetical protein
MPTQFSHSEGKHIVFFFIIAPKNLNRTWRIDSIFFNICLQEIMYEAIAFEIIKIETDINQIIDVHYFLLTE